MKCIPYKSKIILDYSGNKLSYKDGKLHSFNDQPAVRYPYGYKAYYKEDKYHRDYNKPSIVNFNGGYKVYHKEGKQYYLEIEE